MKYFKIFENFNLLIDNIKDIFIDSDVDNLNFNFIEKDSYYEFLIITKTNYMKFNDEYVYDIERVISIIESEYNCKFSNCSVLFSILKRPGVDNDKFFVESEFSENDIISIFSDGERLPIKKLAVDTIKIVFNKNKKIVENSKYDININDMKEVAHDIFIDNNIDVRIVRPFDYDTLLVNNPGEFNIILEKWKGSNFTLFNIDYHLEDSIHRLNRMMEGYEPYFYIKQLGKIHEIFIKEDDYIKVKEYGSFYKLESKRVLFLQISYKKIK
jgi:hypothetical protein